MNTSGAGRWARRVGLLGLLTVSLALQAASSLAGTPTLEAEFVHPPDSAKPWVYWWWLKGNVDKPTITRDLEAMKRVGFGGFLLFDARGYHEGHVPPPPSRMEFMSPEWRQHVAFALREAHRLGLEVSINLSSCAGALKGPWEVGDDAPKKLLWTATECLGPSRFTAPMSPPPGKRFWDVALLAVRHEAALPPSSNSWREAASPTASSPIASQVVDLSGRIDSEGQLRWEVPAGRWTLLRFVCTPLEGHEYDVDILDPKAVEGHFRRMGETLLQDAGRLAGETLTHFYSVSWEGAIPTWTRALETEFRKYRGYDLRPWLPALAGFAVGGRETSDRFLRDYHRTLADCFRDHFYGTMQRLCQRHGLRWHSESGGPWERARAVFGEADQLAFLGRNDMPQGEFWFTASPTRRRQDFNRAPAMAAHVYGRPLVAAEAFTHMLQHWSAYPAALKPFADSAFCDGVNHLVWHTFTASPRALGLPGCEYFAGTHLNPNVTWFPQAGPFVRYLGRCQFLLRQGRFVGDVCVYAGDKPYVHWGRGTQGLAPSSAGVPKGYALDLIDTESLLDRLTTKDGELALPDGLRYRVLAIDLPDDTAPPAALRKLAALKAAGATLAVGGRRPRQAPGLERHPAGDAETRQWAEQLWSQPTTIAEALQARRLPPDFEGPWDYVHRRTDDADLYFVSGQGAAECVFRSQGKQPEFWDAVSGQVTPAPRWSATEDGRTRVALDLPENGSVFVVFRRAALPSPAATAAPSPRTERTLNGSWSVRFEPGRGAPTQAHFNSLIPWNQHPENGIRFYSGKATYRQTFELSREEARSRVCLHLGTVHCLAQVKLNGRDLGIVWTAPWSIELTKAARTGRNELELDVVNTWVNRLIGDAALPPSQRITRSNLALQTGQRTLKAYQGFASEDPLMPSGLLGPVRLEFSR